jgi:hypothetical protein
MAIWLERCYLVLGGVAVGRGFEPQSDLKPFFTITYSLGARSTLISAP